MHSLAKKSTTIKSSSEEIHTQTCQNKNAMEKSQSHLICDENQDEIMEEISNNSKSLIMEGPKSAKNSVVDNSFKCENCGSKFKLKSDFHGHISKCLMMKCHQCKATFANKKWFDAHSCSVKNRSSKSVKNVADTKCHKCDQSFANDYLLNIHMSKCPKKRKSKGKSTDDDEIETPKIKIISNSKDDSKSLESSESTKIYVATDDDQVIFQKSLAAQKFPITEKSNEDSMIRENPTEEFKILKLSKGPHAISSALLLHEKPKLVNQFVGFFSCDFCGFKSSKEGIKIHSKFCRKGAQKSKTKEPSVDVMIIGKNPMEVDPLEIIEIAPCNSGSDITQSNENSVEFEKQVDNQDMIDVDEEIEIIFEGNNDTKEEEEQVVLSNCSDDDEKEKKQLKFKSELAQLFKFLPEKQFPKKEEEIKKDETKKNDIKVVVVTNDVKNNFDCKFCSTAFDSEKSLILHVSVYHSEKFKCIHCEAEFEERPLLLRHIWNYHEKGDYPCKFCDKLKSSAQKVKSGVAYKGFKCESALRDHVKKWHKNEEDSSYLKCYFCQDYFIEERRRRFHIRKKHLKLIVYQKFENYSENDISDQNSMCKCLECSKVFMSKKDLYEHNKDEHSLKCDKCNKIFLGLPKCDLPYFFKKHKSICNYTNQIEDDDMICKYCQEKFDTYPKLKEHFENVHQKSKVCEKCGKSFGFSKLLEKHSSIVHEGQKNHHCDLCARRFSRRHELKNHKLKNHDKELNYKCDTCGKAFFKQGDLNRHVAKFHEKRLDYKCESCFEGFFNGTELRDHILRAHQNPELKCEICEKDFNSSKLLREHMINAHDSARPFKCDLCDRSFHVKCDLKIHVNSCHKTDPNEDKNMDIKKHQCDVCGRLFKAKVYLKQHYATHTGEKICGTKTEICNICKASFTRLDNLETHKKTVHRGIKRIKWGTKKSSKVDENSK